MRSYMQSTPVQSLAQYILPQILPGMTPENRARNSP